jgi:transcriptional regulator with XRE-family HTH domain
MAERGKFYIWDGAALRAAREAAGLSREQVAVAVSKSATAIVQFETDYRSPAKETLKALAIAVGVRPRDLVIEDPMFAEAP